MKEPPADEERSLGRGAVPGSGRRPGGGRGTPAVPSRKGPWAGGLAAAAHGAQSRAQLAPRTCSRGFPDTLRTETRGTWEEPAEGKRPLGADGCSPGKREGPRTGEGLAPAPRARVQSGLGQAAAASPEPEEAPHGPQPGEQRPGQAWGLPDAEACAGLCRRNRERRPWPRGGRERSVPWRHAGAHLPRLCRACTYRLCPLSHGSYDNSNSHFINLLTSPLQLTHFHWG